jgi:hypothetical protein
MGKEDMTFRGQVRDTQLARMDILTDGLFCIYESL